jgi:hypothetical protein
LDTLHLVLNVDLILNLTFAAKVVLRATVH